MLVGNRPSRRQVVQSAGAVGLGLLAGCGRLPGQATAPAPAKMPRLGFLAEVVDPNELTSPNHAAFLQGLRELGHVDGESISIEWRSAEGRLERLPALATELASLPADVIVASGPASIRAAEHATRTIPIVMLGSADPVGTGLVASYARPGGNVTGPSMRAPEMSGKRLELLKEVVPGASRVAVLRYMGEATEPPEWADTQEAAQALSVQLLSLEVRSPAELESAFDSAVRERAEALLIIPAPFFRPHRARLAELAARSQLPAMYQAKLYVEAGGLMAYGPSFPASFHRAAYYVDRILKGTKPADLPIEQPMRFEFVINLRTAQALGLTIPQSVLLQVTEVIQ